MAERPYPTDDIPKDVLYDPKRATFRGLDGRRKGQTFDGLWFPRAGEFPRFQVVTEADDEASLIRDYDRDNVAENAALDQNDADAMGLVGPDAPIPAGVYYLSVADNFYDNATRKGMGVAFHNRWKDRHADFPQARVNPKMADDHDDHDVINGEDIMNERVGPENYEPADCAPAKDANPKTAAGRAKPAMEFVPPVPLMYLAEVMRGGAAKYGAFNWRDAPVSETTYYSAAHRHLAAWFDGQQVDPESGHPHLAHVMACCAILLDAEASESLHHDRPRPGTAAEIMTILAKRNQPKA